MLWEPDSWWRCCDTVVVTRGTLWILFLVEYGWYYYVKLLILRIYYLHPIFSTSITLLLSTHIDYLDLLKLYIFTMFLLEQTIYQSLVLISNSSLTILCWLCEPKFPKRSHRECLYIFLSDTVGSALRVFQCRWH